jgi:hypothetical protein
LTVRESLSSHAEGKQRSGEFARTWVSQTYVFVVIFLLLCQRDRYDERYVKTDIPSECDFVDRWFDSRRTLIRGVGWC